MKGVGTRRQSEDGMRGLEESGAAVVQRAGIRGRRLERERGLARVVKRNGRNEISSRELGEAVTE